MSSSAQPGGWGGTPERAAKRPAALARRDAGALRPPGLGPEVPVAPATPALLAALRRNLPTPPAGARAPVARDEASPKPRRLRAVPAPRNTETSEGTPEAVGSRNTKTSLGDELDPRVGWGYLVEEATDPHRRRQAAIHESAGWDSLRLSWQLSAAADQARPSELELERWRALERRAGLELAGGRAWLDDAARPRELEGRKVQARHRLDRRDALEFARLDELVAPWVVCVELAKRYATSATRHAHRARAHNDRWNKLGECGRSWELRAQCAEHGELDHSVPVRCGHVRLCLECRGRRASMMRERVRAFVDAATNPARALATLRWNERTAGELVGAGVRELLAAAALAPARDRWSLRFVTLTIPHRDARTDVRSALDCWAGFARRMRKHLKARGHDSIGYVRVLEVTPGTDKSGHAHVHAIVWGPFIRGELVRFWWGSELERRGYKVPRVELAAVLLGSAPGCTTAGGADRRLSELAGRAWDREAAPGLERWRGNRYLFPRAVPWPVIDVRRVVEKATRDDQISQRDIADELVKYLVKDLGPTLEDGSRERAAPDLMAAIYEATEGRRLIVAGRGVWVVSRIELGPRQVCTCEECGALPQWRATRLVHVLDARGPPAAARRNHA